MKRSVFLFLLFLLGFQLKAQINNIFPELSGNTLQGKEVILPVSTNGKYTIIGMAYSQKSDEDLRTWYQPVYDTFIDKTGFFNYDVHMYFIPMVTGVKQVAAETIEKKLKQSTDPQLYANVLFFKGSIDAYKKPLNFDGKDKPYFYILDEKGIIVYFTSGEYNARKMEEIEAILADFLN